MDVVAPTPRAWHLAARLHAALWLFGGLWPLVSLRSLMAGTWHTREGRLVRSVAAPMVAGGAGLVHAARRRHVDPGLALAVGTGAAALAVIDVAPGGPGRHRSHLDNLDAAAHAAVAALWPAGALARRHHAGEADAARAAEEIPTPS
ncbi:MAG TPA: hypothetical protein VNT51_09005 [Miltoncostaeaceae bacterium]|nr:hypothetical protein [Miltoncostaeaceae bacterium]